jgi:hypothetical protein
MPRINVQAANHPCSDRIVFVGDISVTRLYKDGIGAAYRASKAAATCAVLQGISSEDFKRFYEPFCRRIEIDNLYGRILFSISYIFQHFRVSRKAMLRIVAFEQQSPSPTKTMSSILWDTFTGSSLYKEVFFRTLRPTFIRIFIWTLAKSIFDS